MAQGMVAGDWIGLPGREANIAFAQHQAAHWLHACLFCVIASAVLGTIALPFYPDASRVPPLVTRAFSFAECLHTPPMLARYSGESDAPT